MTTIDAFTNSIVEGRVGSETAGTSPMAQRTGWFLQTAKSSWPKVHQFKLFFYYVFLRLRFMIYVFSFQHYSQHVVRVTWWQAEHQKGNCPAQKNARTRTSEALFQQPWKCSGPLQCEGHREWRTPFIQLNVIEIFCGGLIVTWIGDYLDPCGNQKMEMHTRQNQWLTNSKTKPWACLKCSSHSAPQRRPSPRIAHRKRSEGCVCQRLHRCAQRYKLGCTTMVHVWLVWEKLSNVSKYLILCTTAVACAHPTPRGHHWPLQPDASTSQQLQRANWPEPSMGPPGYWWNSRSMIIIVAGASLLF